MRKFIPYLLILGVMLFYAGSVGAAAAPYYGAVRSFVADATSKDGVARPTAPPASPTARGGVPSTLSTLSTPAPTASAQASPTAVPSPTASSTPPNAATLPTTRATAARTPTRKGGAAGTSAKGTVAPTLTPRQLQAEVQHIRSTKVPQGRINVLILGSDNDPKFLHYTHPPTQVMIVLSLNTVSHKITLLSISRDLWVHIPGYRYNTLPDGSGDIGWSKIMIASKLDFDSSACTVETNFGIPIDHWIWVGLNGFTNVIDTLHGATVDATHPVVDDTYPDDLSGNPNAYRRVYIPPGPQHLDGHTALQFVRSRHGDAQGDFGRSDRQQILIDQLRRTFAGKDTTALLSLLPNLLHDFSHEMKTDSPVDAQTAYQYLQLFQVLEHSKPTQVVLSPPYSYGQISYDHDPDVVSVTRQDPTQEDALTPNWDQINPLIQRLFGGQLSLAQMPHNHCKQVPGALP